MKKLFSWLFRKKNKPDNQSKIFEFYIHEIICAGDYNKYIVEASNKEEAFKKLVNYFYGDGAKTDIKSESGIVRQPQHDEFSYYGMPRWFAKCISAENRNPSDREKLEEYCKRNNIPFNP